MFSSSHIKTSEHENNCLLTSFLGWTIVSKMKSFSFGDICRTLIDESQTDSFCTQWENNEFKMNQPECSWEVWTCSQVSIKSLMCYTLFIFWTNVSGYLVSFLQRVNVTFLGLWAWVCSYLILRCLGLSSRLTAQHRCSDAPAGTGEGRNLKPFYCQTSWDWQHRLVGCSVCGGHISSGSLLLISSC